MMTTSLQRAIAAVAFFIWCPFVANADAPAPGKIAALREFGKVPVLEQGRYKPWDSVGRNDLLLLYERQSWKAPDRNWTAIEWLAEVLFDPATADNRAVFRVMHPDVRILLGDRTEEQKFFSFREILPSMQKIAEQADRARRIEAQLRNSYQRAVLSLYNDVTLFHGLKRTILPAPDVPLSTELAAFTRWTGDPLTAFQHQQAGEEFNAEYFNEFLQRASLYRDLGSMARGLPVPPLGTGGDGHWISIWDGLVQSAPQRTPNAVISHYARLADYYTAGDWTAFATEAQALRQYLASVDAGHTSKAWLEAIFNHLELFYRTSVAYAVVFLLVLVSWVKWTIPLNRLAFWLVVIAFVAHTVGMILRMIIQGRPPVTNLYSSALFVGWGAVLLGVVLERLFCNGLGSATSAVVGFLSLIVAHNLAGDGDTMAMLQAVLDTNFWLATHVVVITMGYASTFLAGFLAAVYIVRGFFTKGLDEATAESLERMVYGIICFSLLFSFVGTVLGGIWADQSWGRFWGWDPKENGALLIVLWNAIILHARWGKIIGRQGLMVTAVFGNIVTAWSWFGTNMLGIGLHSYGFTEQGFFWLVAFAVSQLLLMAIGAIPPGLWDSFSRDRVKIDDSESACQASIRRSGD